VSDWAVMGWTDEGRSLECWQLWTRAGSVIHACCPRDGLCLCLLLQVTVWKNLSNFVTALGDVFIFGECWEAYRQAPLLHVAMCSLACRAAPASARMQAPQCEPTTSAA
jgi:hypothetical protein